MLKSLLLLKWLRQQVFPVFDNIFSYALCEELLKSGENSFASKK